MLKWSTKWLIRLALSALLPTAVVIPAAAVELPPGRVVLRNYGSEQGLLNVNPIAMTQDREGYLWVGTQDGMYRFDGQRFERFGTEHGLLSDFMTVVYESPTHRLWAGSLKGIAFRNGDRFISMGPKEGIPSEKVYDITTFASTGEQWVAMKLAPLHIGTEQGFRPMPGWPGGFATALSSSENPERMWVTVTEETPQGKHNLLRSYANGKWEDWAIPTSDPLETLEAVQEDKFGRVWVRGRTRLWKLSLMDASLEAFAPEFPAPNLNSRLAQDSQGRLLVPSSEGLHMVQGSELLALGPQYYPGLRWSNSAYEDREGSLWIGGLGLGLNRVLGRGIWKNWTKMEGLPSELVWSAFRDSEDTLWLGTQSGMAFGGQKSWELIDATKLNSIFAITEGPRGSVWAAGKPGIIYHYDLQKKTIRQFGAKEGNLSETVLDLAYLGKQIWAATSKGLLRADTSEAEPRFAQEVLPAEATDAWIYHLNAAPSGRLWASTSKGLLVLENGRWRYFSVKDGLLSNNVFYTVELANGLLLSTCADAHGISRFRYKDEHLEVIRHPDGSETADSLRVYSITRDARDWVWIGTGRGLVVRTPSGEDVFGVQDGLVSEDFSPGAFADKNGDMWFGTTGALLQFQASHYQGPPKPPRVVIRSAWVGGIQLNTHDKRREVEHNESVFKSRFAALTFIGEGKVEYQARLQGIDENWQTYHNPEVLYAALAPGKYQFEVRARVAPGLWGPAESVQFAIKPAWYQSVWIKVLAALALAGMGSIGARLRVQVLRRRNLILEGVVSERTRELKVANENLHKLSITDPLTGLQNRRSVSQLMDEEVNVMKSTWSSRGEDLAKPAGNLVFVLVDVDHFKSVNDKFGHQVGDRLLAQMSQILRANVGPQDIVVRWGGEEFLLVLRDRVVSQALQTIETLRRAVAENSIKLDDETLLQRTCSLGFATFPLAVDRPELATWEQVVDIADQCLYVAKRRGRNRWVGFDVPQENSAALEKALPVDIDQLVTLGSDWIVMGDTSIAPDNGMTPSLVEGLFTKRSTRRPQSMN